MNTEEDTEGCIGLGNKIGFLEVNDEDSGQKIRKLAVLDSRTAHQQFLAELQGVNEFILIVRDYRGS
jgi:hypothetical protein